jgi:hypothetical protein
MDEHNRCVQIRGTDNASHVFQTLMSAALEQTSGTGKPLTAEVEKAMVANIAKVSEGVEFSDLLGAYEMGLISRHDFEREAAGIKPRFEAALARYPSKEWSFTNKASERVTRG